MQHSYFDATNDLLLATLTKPVSRRTLLLTLAAGLGAATVPLLASCVAPPAAPGTTGGAAPQAASEQVKLQFWQYQTGDDETIWNNMIHTFNDQHPSLEVEPIRQPYQDFASKLSAALAEGRGPDFVFVNSLGEIAESCDRCVDLETKLGDKGLDLKAEFAPKMLDAGRNSGVLVGLPMDVRPIAAIINKAHALAVGLDTGKPPTDKDSLLDWARQMTQYDETSNITRSGFLLTETGSQPNLVFGIIATQGGARYVNEYCQATDFYMIATQVAAQWILDAYDVHKIADRLPPDPNLSPDQSLVQDFKAELGSMLWTGPGALRAFAQGPDNLIVTKVPNVGGTEQTLGPISILTVFTPSDQDARQDTAIEAIKWLSDNSLLWVANGPGLPLRKSMLEDDVYKNSPLYDLRQPFMESLENLYVENFAWDLYTGPEGVGKAMDPVWAGTNSVENGLTSIKSVISTNLILCCKCSWPCCKKK